MIINRNISAYTVFFLLTILTPYRATASLGTPIDMDVREFNQGLQQILDMPHENVTGREKAFKKLIEEATYSTPEEYDYIKNMLAATQELLIEQSQAPTIKAFVAAVNTFHNNFYRYKTEQEAYWALGPVLECAAVADRINPSMRAGIARAVNHAQARIGKETIRRQCLAAVVRISQAPSLEAREKEFNLLIKMTDSTIKAYPKLYGYLQERISYIKDNLSTIKISEVERCLLAYERGDVEEIVAIVQSVIDAMPKKEIKVFVPQHKEEKSEATTSSSSSDESMVRARSLESFSELERQIFNVAFDMINKARRLFYRAKYTQDSVYKKNCIQEAFKLLIDAECQNFTQSDLLLSKIINKEIIPLSELLKREGA